jgi:hypothetical protein
MLVAVAAAAVGAVEVLVARLALPVLWHVPSGEVGRVLGSPLAGTGDLATQSTAILVGAGATALAIRAFSMRQWMNGSALVFAVVGTAVLTAGPPLLLSVAMRGALILAAVAIAGLALRRRNPLLVAPAVTAAAVAVVAQWLFATDDLQRILPAGPALDMVTAHAISELLLVATFIAAAVAVSARGNVPQTAWIAAVAASALAAAILARDPANAAILSRWAFGATLSLPTVLYIAAAAGGTLALVTWLVDPASRHLAAGLVLVAVAGAQPAYVHHNLTLLFAAALLAMPPTVVAASFSPAARPRIQPMAITE